MWTIITSLEKNPVLHYSAVAGTHWKNSWPRADFFCIILLAVNNVAPFTSFVSKKKPTISTTCGAHTWYDFITGHTKQNRFVLTNSFSRKGGFTSFACNLIKIETKCYEVIMLPLLVASHPLAAFEAFDRFSRNSVWMLCSTPYPCSVVVMLWTC